jgi:hypothetical protein
MGFCSQTLSPAPTERRPPTFVADAVCLSKPVPGSATNVAGAGSVLRIHMFWTRRAPWIFALKPFPRRRRSVALQLLWRARFAFRNPFRVPLRGGAGSVRARGQSRVFTCFGLEGRRGFLLSNSFPGADGASPSNFCGGRGLPFETRSGFRYERGGRGVSPAYLLVLDSKGAVDFCSQTLSPAPTERRPPTFGWGRGLPFETRSGFRYERDLGS